ncbi:MAG: 16S rRNA processing protein RimM [Magnetococcales bacterium]|nr:16S rRNA processing protein RimM [Magnetococcales bacterium]
MPEEGTPWVALGRIKGAFGVRGEVRVIPLPLPIARILPDAHPEQGLPEDWLLGQPRWRIGRSSPPDREVTLLAGRSHGMELLVRFAGLDNREQLQTLAGMRIWVPEADLPNPGEAHHYWFRLIGMRVLVLPENGSTAMETPLETLGVVETVLATGSNDVLVVREPCGEERLLPWIRDVIRKVDESTQTILVQLMDGL